MWVLPLAQVSDIKSQLLLIGGAALLYTGARAAVETLSPSHDFPAGRALGHWLAISVVVLFAMFSHQPGVAMAVVLGTSVGALSLVNGSIYGILENQVAGTKERESDERASRWRLFAIPVAAVIFLAGLESQLRVFHAVVLWVLAIAIGFVLAPTISLQPLRGLGRKRIVDLALALAICLLGGYLTIRAITHIAGSLNISSPQLVATTALSPLLVLPMILTGARVVRSQPHRLAIDAHVLVVLLNLTVLLPVCILIAWLQGAALSFPLNLWRIDGIALLLLAIFLLPGALRVRHGTSEGVAMVLFYFGYILIASIVSTPLMQLWPRWLRAL